jgi:glycosyltransferase involved in cell wall biosynthesis
VRIAILTPNFSEFDPATSLSHVILDQARCLTRHGHEVALFVSEEFEGVVPDSGRLWECLPSKGKSDDLVSDTVRAFHDYLSTFDVVFTHDWISRAWMRPYYEGLKQYAQTEDSSKLTWYHWIHSIPTRREEWWRFNDLPLNHWLVYENYTDAAKTAAQFMTTMTRTKVVYPISDIRILADWSSTLWKITDAFLGLINADYVQVYPAAANRFNNKGVEKVINTFAAIKEEGYSVALLIVDSWTGLRKREDKEIYRRKAERVKLWDDEFKFMSDIIPDFRGLSRTDLYKLRQLANVFVFPTDGEAFGLVLPESILAGSYPVSNGSLNMMREICPNGSTVEFGSHERRPRVPLDHAFYEKTAKGIIEQTQKNSLICDRDVIRKSHNLDAIYETFYRPVLEAS